MTLDKIQKKLKQEVRDEIDTKSEQELEKLIADSQQSICTARAELDANEEYSRARNDVSLLSQGMKDVKSYQTAKIEYALHLLRERRA